MGEEQPAKQLSPKLVTDAGIRVFLHPAIIVFDSVSIMALQPSRESYLELAASTTMDSREGQDVKQLPSIFITEEGIFIDVSEGQSQKHLSPILITEEGISLDVSEQP